LSENNLKDALQYVAGLSNLAQEIKVTDVGGLLYSSTDLKPVMPPVPSVISVATLAGLAELIPLVKGTAGDLSTNVAKAGELLVVISDYRTVHVMPKLPDAWNRRPIVSKATAPEPSSNFGKWMDPEPFKIWLLSGFASIAIDGKPGRDDVFNIASNVTGGVSEVNSDNGIVQQVTVKRGVELKENAVVQNRVCLAPFRTFRDFPQPISEFIFRVQQVNETKVQLALFEADGGTWQIDAANAIQQFLKKEINDDSVAIVR
jgi:hypothetical protein